MRRIPALTLVIAMAALLMLAPSTARAAPYYSYVFDERGDYYPVPSPYEPADALSLAVLQPGENLKTPRDIKVGPDGNLYIADSGNNRIVVMTPEGRLLRTMGSEEDGLFQPEGVFLDELGQVYVADYGNSRIVIYDSQGNRTHTIPKPESRLLGPDFKYAPVKLAVNPYGFMYVVSRGSSNGLVVLDTEGTFHGFFGGNTVDNSWIDKLIRRLFSREDRRGTGKVVLPYSYNNLAIDSNGFLYVTTTGLDRDQLKKLNGTGRNVLKSKNYREPKLSDRSRQQPDFAIVATDRHGNVTLIDRMFGLMYQFDRDGNLLFVFGGSGSSRGLLSRPSAAAIGDNGTIYVLEEQLGIVKVFKRTEFAAMVHAANELFHQGRYEQSLPLWQEVYRLNSYYKLALQGLAKAHLRQQDETTALGYFADAKDRIGYSEAFTYFRKNFARDHFLTFTYGAAGAVLLSILLSAARKRWKRRTAFAAAALAVDGMRPGPVFSAWRLTGESFRRGVGISFRPFDGFSALRYERDPTYIEAAILMLVYFVLHMTTVYWAGFHFQTQNAESVNWWVEAAVAFAPWLVFAFVNYGIATIADGEGRLKDVVVATAYAHMPLILVAVPLLLLSNVLSLDEAEFFGLLRTAAYAWTAWLLLVSIREVHDYEWPKSFAVYGISLFGVALVALLAVAVRALTVQVYDFIEQVVNEVIIRGF